MSCIIQFWGATYHVQGLLVNTGMCGDPIIALDLVSFIDGCIITEVELLYGDSFYGARCANVSPWLAKGRTFLF